MQETRRSDAKSSDVERVRGINGYKLLYFGSPHTQYGIGIAISEGFRDSFKEVERFNDRLMKLTIISADRTIHFFTAYAPQTSRPDAEKDAFRQLLDDKTCQVPADDYIMILLPATLMVMWVKRQTVPGAMGERGLERAMRVANV